MNEDFELRNRLASADPGKAAPDLNEGLVAQAALGKAPRLSNFRVARLTMAAASLSIVGLAITSVTLPQSSTGPLFELAQAGGQSTAAMSTAESGSADGKMAADSMMIWPGFSYNYLPGDLSNQPGRGKVYQAELVGDPIQILNELAQYFEIEGQPKRDEWASDEYPSYSIQGETSSLGIYFSGTGGWYYSSWSNASYACESASSDDEGSRSEEYCEPKLTPELIPSEAQMLAQAIKLFGDLGISVDSSAAKLWRDDWGGSVSFPNIQNGIDTGMDFYIGWDMSGNISYAAGYSFRLVERGEFDTIGAYDAVARIADGRWYGGAPSSFYQEMAVAYESVASSPLARDDSAQPSVEPLEGEDLGAIEYQEPEVQDLLVVRSEAVTLSVFDANGNYWYVPGYILFNEQGWFDSIISLEEGVIALPEPYDYGIMPAETFVD